MHLISYRGNLVRESGIVAFEERAKHIEDTTPLLLNILRQYNTKITFFVTGRLYEKIPGLIDEIYNNGHEIGWHGHHHHPITNSDILAKELDASKHFINKFKPKGFRAPWLKFDEALLPVLRDAGFLYDSSLFASNVREYEISGMKIFPVTAIPLLTGFMPQYNTGSRFLQGMSLIPIGSNFMFSLLRYNYDIVLRLFESRSQNCIFYLHNWQMFPWPERELSLIRDKFRYVQKYPLSSIVEFLLKRHDFHKMCNLLNRHTTKKGHFLAFDME